MKKLFSVSCNETLVQYLEAKLNKMLCSIEISAFFDESPLKPTSSLFLENDKFFNTLKFP